MSDQRPNGENLINFIATTVETMRGQMATKDDLLKLRNEVDTIRDEVGIMRGQMATKDDLVNLATKDDLLNLATKDDLKATTTDLARLETKVDVGFTTVRGDFEQVHLRFDTLDRALSSRMGHIETEVSRLRSVVYLLVRDKPDMLRLLGQ